MAHENSDPSAYLRELWTPEEGLANGRIETAKALHVECDRDTELADRHLKRLTFNATLRRDPSIPHAANNRAEGKAIMIVGGSGAGKSRLLRRTFKNHAAFPNFGVDGVWCPLISVGAPSPCTLLQLAIRILIRLGYPITRGIAENGAWLRVREQLQLQRILFLHIDDLQHVLHTLGEDEVQKVRDTLKDLMTSTDWPVQLILSGLPDLLPFVRQDRQLRRRMRFMVLSQLNARHHSGFLEEAINAYANTAGLVLEVKPEDALVGRLLHAGVYEMGICLEIIGEAIESAFQRSDKTLTIKDFADGFASRNLLPDDQNPFTAYAWDALDVSLLRPKELDPDEDEPDSKPAPKRRRRRK
jgi:hypothetical protein